MLLRHPRRCTPWFRAVPDPCRSNPEGYLGGPFITYRDYNEVSDTIHCRSPAHRNRAGRGQACSGLRRNCSGWVRVCPHAGLRLKARSEITSVFRRSDLDPSTFCCSLFDIRYSFKRGAGSYSDDPLKVRGSSRAEINSAPTTNNCVGSGLYVNAVALRNVLI